MKLNTIIQKIWPWFSGDIKKNTEFFKTIRKCPMKAIGYRNIYYSVSYKELNLIQILLSNFNEISESDIHANQEDIYNNV